MQVFFVPGSFSTQPYISEIALANSRTTFLVFSWLREKGLDTCFSDIPRNVILIEFVGRWGRFNYLVWLFQALCLLGQCNKVIVSTLPAILLVGPVAVLRGKKCILDIRDHSPLYSGIFRSIINWCILKSDLTFISSPGFKKWLPPNSDRYRITHNFKQSEKTVIRTQYSRSIVCLGKIRDTDKYLELFSLNARRTEPYEIIVAGFGNAYNSLHRQFHSSGTMNFIGKYHGAEEFEILAQGSILSVVTGDDINGRSLISNRFYLALAMKKLMIVSEGSYQETLLKKYAAPYLLVGDLLSLKDDEVRHLWQRCTTEYESVLDNFRAEYESTITYYSG